MSEPLYKVGRNGKVSSDYTFDKLAKSWAMGRFKPTDTYWTKGMVGWRPLSSLKGDIEGYLASARNREASAGTVAASNAQPSSGSNATVVYHFSRGGQEFARYPLSVLKASWPADIRSTDMCWMPGQHEWRPAWQLQNELLGPSSPASKRRTAPRRPMVPTRPSRVDSVVQRQVENKPSTAKAVLGFLGGALILMVVAAMNSASRRNHSNDYSSYD